MKKAAIAIIGVVATINGYAQTKSVSMEQTITQFQHYFNNNKTDSAVMLMSDKARNSMPESSWQAMLTQLHEAYGSIKKYTYVKKSSSFSFYKTVFEKDTMILAVAVDKDYKLTNFRFSAYEPEVKIPSNIQLNNIKDTIYGTLTLPEVPAGKKVPVVLFVAGSGPTDRDGNTGKSIHINSYKMLADSLQENGIASVRYDKRGVGASKSPNLENEEDIHFEDEVNDAAGFIKMLKQDTRFSQVIVLGHSEGSLIGMLAANREKANAFISVAGAAESADKILVKQLASGRKMFGDKARVILDSMKKGYTPMSSINEEPTMQEVFRPSSLPYLKSWMKYSPQTEIKKLTCKVLIVQGSTDMQVGIDQAELLKEAKPGATLKIINGMSHILKNGPTDRMKNLSTYTAVYLPLNDEITSVIVKFIGGK